MLVPPRGASTRAFGAADALECRRGIGQIELRGSRVQCDQHRVRLQHDRVADDVVPGGEVEHRMRGDRLLDRGGVVGLVRRPSRRAYGR